MKRSESISLFPTGFFRAQIPNIGQPIKKEKTQLKDRVLIKLLALLTGSLVIAIIVSMPSVPSLKENIWINIETGFYMFTGLLLVPYLLIRISRRSGQLRTNLIAICLATFSGYFFLRTSLHTDHIIDEHIPLRISLALVMGALYYLMQYLPVARRHAALYWKDQVKWLYLSSFIAYIIIELMHFDWSSLACPPDIF